MIGTILTSSVIAAIVAAAVAVWTTQRRISIENITQDRRQWREKVRERALAVHDVLIARDEEKLNRLRSEFRTILNPCDDYDDEIISYIAIPDEGKEADRADEFAKKISSLLKHDWERVKLEAGPVILRFKRVGAILDRTLYKPQRSNYQNKDYYHEKK